MKDHRFTIDKELELLIVRLSILLFLCGHIQLLKDETTGSQSTDCVRIHVERTVKQIKKFHVLNHIPLSLHGSVAICCKHCLYPKLSH